MVSKFCPKCKQDLPKSSFTSTQSKYCNPCKRIHQLELAYKRTKDVLARKESKKPKVGVVRSLASLKKVAQRVFNQWVRERDKSQPCLACGRYSENMDASHYIAQGSSGLLRYHPENVHNTCYACNRYKHGNLIEYRIGLVKKIGIDRVVWLEEHRHDIKKWEREEVEEIIRDYKERLKEL